MILHFSHIGLTDGRTFMIPFGGWGPVSLLWLPQGLPTLRHGCAQPQGHAKRADEPQ